MNINLRKREIIMKKIILLMSILLLIFDGFAISCNDIKDKSLKKYCKLAESKGANAEELVKCETLKYKNPVIGGVVSPEDRESFLPYNCMRLLTQNIKFEEIYDCVNHYSEEAANDCLDLLKKQNNYANKLLEYCGKIEDQTKTDTCMSNLASAYSDSSTKNRDIVKCITQIPKPTTQIPQKYFEWDPKTISERENIICLCLGGVVEANIAADKLIECATKAQTKDQAINCIFSLVNKTNLQNT